MPKRMVSSLQVNERIVDFFMVTECHLKERRTGEGHYLALRLGDRSGCIEARVWERAESMFQQLRVEDVVKIDGRVEVYRDEIQLRVDRVRVADRSEYALEDFLPCTEKNLDDLRDKLTQVIETIANPYLSRLLAEVLDEDTFERFSKAPGAKRIHHAYIGGLLEHTLEVISYCLTAVQQQPQLDRDLLLCGAILHDLGKLQEYSFERSIDFTDEGKLIGHITLGHDIINRCASQIEGFPEETLLKLRHLIISHHGHYEWQSPKRPKTLEACVLHLADYFSSQVSIFTTVMKESQASQAPWTAYSKYLDRSIFVGSAFALPNYDEEVTQSQHRLMEERYQGY